MIKVKVVFKNFGNDAGLGHIFRQRQEFSAELFAVWNHDEIKISNTPTQEPITETGGFATAPAPYTKR